MSDPVITVEAIQTLAAPVAFADVRWYLEEPERGREEYDRGHLPGASYVDLEAHLSAAEGPGRHPLPSREEFAESMSSLGLGNDTRVVAYDDRGGAVAARLWWMLRDIGHESVWVLDGGVQAWVAAGLPLDTDSPKLAPATLTVRPPRTRQLERAELRGRLGSLTLLDARAPERYRGEEEPVDPVAGHIPTAISADLNDNLDDALGFLSPEALQQRFTDLGVTPGRDTVVYCGSGVTACHNALAMVRAGLTEPILYPGSWSDWGSNGGEVAVGAEPGTLDLLAPPTSNRTDD